MTTSYDDAWHRLKRDLQLKLEKDMTYINIKWIIDEMNEREEFVDIGER